MVHIHKVSICSNIHGQNTIVPLLLMNCDFPCLLFLKSSRNHHLCFTSIIPIQFMVDLQKKSMSWKLPPTAKRHWSRWPAPASPDPPWSPAAGDSVPRRPAVPRRRAPRAPRNWSPSEGRAWERRFSAFDATELGIGTLEKMGGLNLEKNLGNQKLREIGVVSACNQNFDQGKYGLSRQKFSFLTRGNRNKLWIFRS